MSPGAVLAHLDAGRLWDSAAAADCPGAPVIAPGDVVTTGTWTDAFPVQAGECWRADFDTLLPPIDARLR